MIWIVLLALLVALLAAPHVLEARRGRPDDKDAPGKFANLSQGRTHYRWIGPVRGPVLVAVHGLSSPSGIWEGIAQGLAGFGYRVLVYDLYGRGWSDAVPGRQDAEFFIRQLEDLLEDQEIPEDVTLLGYSMGGAIITAFAARHPERSKRLILLAPTGIEPEEDKVHRFMRQWPVLGDWLHGIYEPVRMRAALIAGHLSASEVPGVAEMQLRELSHRGFFPALLASRRGMLNARLRQEHHAIGIEDIPVVAIWGEKDEVVPLKGLGTLAQWNRAARQEVVEGAGHGLVHTHVTAVMALLRDVLRESWGSR